MSVVDEVQRAIDEAREEGCPLCPDPRPTTVFLIRVIAVHPECLHDPEPDEDEEEKVN